MAGCNGKPPYYLTAYGLAVKHGFKGTEEEWLESLKCVPEEVAVEIIRIQTKVEQLLVETVAASGQAKEAEKKAKEAADRLEIDATLSLPGMAADARVVGEALEGRLAGIESTEHPGCYYRVVNGETEWLNPPMVVDEEYRTSERYMGKPVYRKLMCFGELPNSGGRAVSTKIPSTASIVGLERMSTEPDKNAYGQHIPHITHEYFLESNGQYRLEVFTDADAAQITYLYYTIKYTKD